MAKGLNGAQAGAHDVSQHTGTQSATPGYKPVTVFCNVIIIDSQRAHAWIRYRKIWYIITYEDKFTALLLILTPVEKFRHHNADIQTDVLSKTLYFLFVSVGERFSTSKEGLYYPS